jgi:hypothetical protein
MKPQRCDGVSCSPGGAAAGGCGCESIDDADPLGLEHELAAWEASQQTSGTGTPASRSP